MARVCQPLAIVEWRKVIGLDTKVRSPRPRRPTNTRSNISPSPSTRDTGAEGMDVEAKAVVREDRSAAWRCSSSDPLHWPVGSEGGAGHVRGGDKGGVCVEAVGTASGLEERAGMQS